MNNIFLRIYAGILFTVVVIGVLAYGSIRVIDHYRANDYRQQMANGTFYLIAQGTERFDTLHEKNKWLALVSRLVGSKLVMATADELQLTADEVENLNKGRVVFHLNNKKALADIYYALPDSNKYLHTRMAKVSEQQARATALLVMDALGRHPQSNWPKVMDRLRQEFGFPIYYQPFRATHLDKEQTQRLLRNEVVLSINDSDQHSGSSIVIYSKIGTSGKVLVLGPLYLFDPYPVELMALIGLLSLLLLALVAYFLVRPLQSRLGHLESVIKRLGEGDLTAQAEVNSHDAIGQLATTFNGMGQHIRRLIESQREMTRAVSHELRTPVARIRFGLEMLGTCKDTDVLRKRLDELDGDIDQLDTLIDEILTFAKLQEGMPSINVRSVFMPDLVTQIQRELQPISPNVRIEADKSSWSDLSAEELFAEGERRYLHRILQNLVNNAVRYGDSKVRIRYYLEGQNACLEVDDNGEGIPDAKRSQIFEPFARLDESRHKKSGGYGLGLSIVQRIMEWHGGYAEVTVSDDLGGARFRIVWPRVRPDGQHVLVAED